MAEKEDKLDFIDDIGEGFVDAFTATPNVVTLGVRKPVETGFNIGENIFDMDNDDSGLLLNRMLDEKSKFDEAVNLESDVVEGLSKLEQLSTPELIGKAGGTFAGATAGFYTTMKALDQLEKTNKDLYKKTRKLFPYTVGQLHTIHKQAPNKTSSILGYFKEIFKGSYPQGLVAAFNPKSKKQSTARRIMKNAAKFAKAGSLLSLLDAKSTTDPLAMALESGQLSQEDLPILMEYLPLYKEQLELEQQKKEQPNPEPEVDLPTRSDITNFSVGGSVDPGQFTNPLITSDEELFDAGDIIKQPGIESIEDLGSLFEEAKLKPTVDGDPPMVELANFGKVPLWAIGNIKKGDIANLPEKTKKFLEALKAKLGTESEVKSKDDIADIDVTSEGKVVGIPKSKKTIIDSPEATEGQFYSGLEARLMDPNTPEVFDDPISLMAFLQQKNISRVELEDNLLLPYLKEMAGQPIPKAELLEIIRKAPLRKIKSSTYGFRSDVLDGENKRAYYGNQYLYNKQGAPKGALENTYRERVLTLAPDEIPQDVGTIPQTAHDFPDKYVIGWTREFDIQLPKKITKAEAQAAAGQGIKGLDIANQKTVEKNIDKIASQLRGLETSAYMKIKRQLDSEGGITIPPIDDVTDDIIRDVVETRRAELIAADEPLFNQINQFRDKLKSDINKLRLLREQNVEKYTFVDEIQSDLLQQSQKLKEKILEDFGESLKNIKTKSDARSFVAAGGRGDQADREVAALFARHGDVFRPIFRTEQEMSSFMKRFDENQRAFEQLASEGIRPSKETIQKAQEAEMIETAMMENLETQLSEAVLKKLFPNLPLKNRQEWGEIMLKRAFSDGSKRLFEEGDPNAPIGLIINTGRNNKNKYSQTGGTDTPYAERTKDMKGVGMEEFYGGPDAKTPEGKHFTSPVEKALKRIAAENNTKLEIIEIDGTKHYKLLFTPEGTQPHKTHRKKGGVVYNQEIIDIFEEA